MTIKSRDTQHNYTYQNGTKYCYAECLGGVSFMLSVANKPIMLSVVMLNAVMLSIVSPKIHMYNTVMLSAIMLNIIMLSVIMLSVIMLNIVMLSVVAPKFGLTFTTVMTIVMTPL